MPQGQNARKPEHTNTSSRKCPEASMPHGHWAIMTLCHKSFQTLRHYDPETRMPSRPDPEFRMAIRHFYFDAQHKDTPKP